MDQVEEIKAFVRSELKALEGRLYAGPRYAALQNGINELIKELAEQDAALKSHDGEEDARYGYYAEKLNAILAESKEDNPEPPAPKA